MYPNLKNKKVILTAGTNGIGKAIVAGFVAAGARVAVCARSEEGLTALKGEFGDQVWTQSVDLFAVDAVTNFVNQAIQELGGVDVLVYNPPHVTKNLISKVGLEDWQQAFDGTYKSMVAATEAVLPSMSKQKSGSIVINSSLAAIEPIDALSLSSVLRGGIDNWVKLMAKEYGPQGIRVNTVLPGYTDTAAVRKGMKKKADAQGKTVEEVIKTFCANVPLGRLAKPEEMANAFLFLASSQASFVTGTHLLVDGGLVKGV
jgi:3-oxoacyl-[acyl-carrier protein] reductase